MFPLKAAKTWPELLVWRYLRLMWLSTPSGVEMASWVQGPGMVALPPAVTDFQAKFRVGGFRRWLLHMTPILSPPSSRKAMMAEMSSKATWTGSGPVFRVRV